MENKNPRRIIGHFNDNIKCWEIPFRSNFLTLSMLVFYFLHAYLLPFEVIMIMHELFPLIFSHHSSGRLRSLILLPWPIRVNDEKPLKRAEKYP